jgi:hypothetical protein
MTVSRHTGFKTTAAMTHVPPCAAEILAALADGYVNEVEADELLDKCRVCARRYIPRGWVSTDSSCGVWQGCAHLDRIKAALKD